MGTRDAPLTPVDQVCELSDPHSSAFVDIDGDCLPDLVLHCERPRTTSQYIQVWLNKGLQGYVLSKSYDLPKGSGSLSFADMNRDGSIDIIFPTCARQSSSAGTGSECSLNIAYNRQAPVCSGIASEWSGADGSGQLKCRGYGELCVADDGFEFAFGDSDDASRHLVMWLRADEQHFTSIPFSTLFAHTQTDPDLLLHAPGDTTVQLPIRPGDFNVDGFPDLLMTISNATAVSHSGMFGGSKGTQVRVLENVGCRKGVPGCTGAQKRGFRVAGGQGWEALDLVVDATGASWVDLDDDVSMVVVHGRTVINHGLRSNQQGSLDILVQRSGAQQEGMVTFIQNNFYHDAFFLKAQGEFRSTGEVHR